jgi:hypothetical protein
MDGPAGCTPATRPKDSPLTVDLLEEAIELLRGSPARAWAIYLAGAVPFLSAILLFWSAMTGAVEPPSPMWGALLLGLFFGMHQFTKARFAATVYASLARSVARPTGWIASLRIFVLVWCSGLVRLPMLLIPVPSVFAFFRNVTVLAATEEDTAGVFRRAASLAGRGGDQISALLIIALVAVVLWLNVFTGMLALPFLFRILTGTKMVIMRNAGALVNSTTVLASALIAWALLDAFMTAFYVSRVFHGVSEESGADLLKAWRNAVSRAAALTLLFICLVPAVRAAARTDLDQAIDQVLAQGPYQWRKPPVLDNRQNAFVQWTDNLLASIRNAKQWLRREWQMLIDWLLNQKGPETRSTRPPITGLRAASWVVIAVLAVVLFTLLLRWRKRPPDRAESTVLPSHAPLDLDDPSIIASQFPEQEWLNLARGWLGRGDYRMALRAYFLASLAFLGGHELLVISRSKTNLDYLRELKRRAKNLPGMEKLFAANVRSFEDGWYGMHPVSATEIGTFTANLERMRTIVG